MKTHQTLKQIRGFAAVSGGMALFTGVLQAAPFVYSSGDLLLAFRQNANAYDYVVNIGKAANYAAIPAGTTIAVTNLSASQLGFAFPSVNGLAWSISGVIRAPDNPSYLQQTLWVSSPRADTAAQSPAWLRKGAYTQGATGGQIDAIGNNAASYSSSQPANAENNSSIGVVIPTGSQDYALAATIGDGGNFRDTFQGSVENTTPGDFDSDAANISRSDLYELLPGSVAAGSYNTPGRYLGYFELKPDGTLTFSTKSSLPPAPSITAIARVGDITTVSFASVTNATYSLLSANADGIASGVGNWTVISSAPGNGGELSLQDTNSAAVRFYAIKVKNP